MTQNSRPSTLQSFQGDLVYPNDPSYSSAIARWASNAERQAALVSFPKTTSDISLVLDYALHQSKPPLPIAVKCGGHSASGASSSEGGVVIDLSRYFSEVRVDPEAKLAYVGGGAIWATVDEKTAEYGLATVAGVVNHTGVGGLTLGGGFGYLTGEHGLVIDNLVQATITLQTGQTLTLSSKADENPDLFWGIRGAGSNFGVVSEFVFRLSPQRRDVYAGVMVFPIDRVEEVCQVANAWWDNGPSEKERLFITLVWNEDMSEVVLQVAPFYNGSEADGRQVFKAFLELNPTQDLTTSLPYIKLNAALNDQFPHGRPYITTGFQTHRAQANPESIRNAAKLYKRHREEDSKLARPIKLNVSVIHEYTPWGKVSSIPDSEGGPFPRNRVNNGLMMATWAENEKEINLKAREMVDEIRNAFLDAKTNQKSEGPKTVEKDFRQSSASKLEGLYGVENYQRLKTLKKTYDAKNVFCSWLPIEID
ncbi:hypothetical protein D9758_016118 [Tetrapyrgos nigripes]|uniref:FAD-binding PCMH-type domain-containing protein n=1 Tax=Tetrapyrgos nigripes TaxID=182062 RepID=A0A8H5FCU1_9AGAR|nr:hypothetical protein D9758_016118 [Tetrapyrgos nigripes]